VFSKCRRAALTAVYGSSSRGWLREIISARSMWDGKVSFALLLVAGRVPSVDPVRVALTRALIALLARSCLLPVLLTSINLVGIVSRAPWCAVSSGAASALFRVVRDDRPGSYRFHRARGLGTVRQGDGANTLRAPCRRASRLTSRCSLARIPRSTLRPMAVSAGAFARWPPRQCELEVTNDELLRAQGETFAAGGSSIR